jgi:hypothetical protein
VSHRSTRAHYRPDTDEVEEPLRSIEHEEFSTPRAVQWGRLLKPFLVSWPLLLLGLILGPAIVLATQSRAPVVYSAEALVAPNRSRTQVQFVPQIKTIDDSTTAAGGSALTPERRQALVDLVRSSNVEALVMKDLNGKLPDSELQQGALVQQINGGIRPRSEILSIQALASSPTDAMLIVNSWARNYVDEVNHLYSSSDSDGSIQALRDRAQQDFQAAQATLNASIATSDLETLDQQIQQKQALLALLQSPYQGAAQGTADTSSDAKPSAASSTQVQVSNAVLNDYRLAERRSLDDLAQTLRRVDATRQTARALLGQAQLNGGGGGSSDAAALALLKTQLVAISDGLPSQLQLQIPSSVGGSTAEDLQTLANSLDAARQQLAADFESRRAAYEANRAQQVSALERELQDLRARREAADAERKRLTAARDLASDTYTALAKKAEEQRVASSTAGHEVELASEATFAAPLPRQTTSALVTAAFAGLVAAAAVAVLRWYAFDRHGFPSAMRFLTAGARQAERRAAR